MASLLEYRNSSSTVTDLIPLIPKQDPLISDEVREWVIYFMDAIIFFLSLLGVVTNSINMRIFVHQGLSSDSSAIGLFGMAVADLFGSFTLIPHMSLCQLMRFVGQKSMAANCHVIIRTPVGAAHLLMARIASWITVYIATERCLCVMMPFKVKTLLTPKFTAFAVCSVYAFFFVTYIPVVSSLRIRWGFSAEFNTTVAMGTDFTIGSMFLKYSSLILNFVLPLTAFFLVTLATGLMLQKLNQFKKWRLEAASAVKGNNIGTKQQNSQSKKDIEVLKTTLVVTTVFLVCLSANLIPGLATAFLPFSLFGGANKNFFLIFYSYRYIMDLINSSINFFFYLRISTKYKTAFNTVFKIK